jgi:hypothetical protein
MRELRIGPARGNEVIHEKKLWQREKAFDNVHQCEDRIGLDIAIDAGVKKYRTLALAHSA